MKTRIIAFMAVVALVVPLQQAVAQPLPPDSTNCAQDNEPDVCSYGFIEQTEFGDEISICPTGQIQYAGSCCPDNTLDIENPPTYEIGAFQSTPAESTIIVVQIEVRPGETISTPYEQYFMYDKTIDEETSFIWSSTDACGTQVLSLSVYPNSSEFFESIGYALHWWTDHDELAPVRVVTIKAATAYKFKGLNICTPGNFNTQIMHYHHAYDGDYPFRTRGFTSGMDLKAMARRATIVTSPWGSVKALYR